MAITFIISQILAAIIAVIFVYSLILKDNKKMFKLLTIESTLNATKSFLLNGISGGVVQLFGVLRNYLKSKGKFTGKIAYTVVILQVVVSSLFNNQGLIGYLPVIASSLYSFMIIKTDDNLKIKKVLILNLTLWVIYDICISDYIGTIVDFGYTVYLSIIVLYETVNNKYRVLEINKAVKRKLKLVKYTNNSSKVLDIS